jgi:ferredoxin-NADP reductase
MAVHKFRLSAITQETPEIKTFRFVPIGKFEFKAGQFVVLKIGNESRAYSISSHPSEHFVELTIRIGTESYFPKKLEQLKVGDIVEIDGPHGTFTLDSAAQNAVFIGAGVGIAGLKSLWSELLHHNPSARIEIVCSARTKDELVWHSAFEKMPPNVSMVYTLTRERPFGWEGHIGHEIGRIDAAMLKRNIKDGQGKYCYICGPPEMVSAVEEALISFGVPATRIKAEKWGGISGSV